MGLLMKAGDRASFPTDYDQYAPTYAWTRWAVPWVLEPLAKIAGGLPSGAAILEIGCGTGNYIWALSEGRKDLGYFGFDASEPMLQQARGRGTSVSFALGDAGQAFPFADKTFELAFAVDVIHHVGHLSRFFAEARRTLGRDGRLVIVTDSEETFRRRSLTRFFPEVLAIERARYPSTSSMHAEARRAGFELVSHTPAEGVIALDAGFLARLEAKCSSAVRLLQPAAFAEGMARVRAAAARGESWLSCYDFLVYAPC